MSLVAAQPTSATPNWQLAAAAVSLQVPPLHLPHICSSGSLQLKARAPRAPHRHADTAWSAACVALPVLLCCCCHCLPLRLAGCRNGSLRIRLDGDEASDIINFVLKDDATNTWWVSHNNAPRLQVQFCPCDMQPCMCTLCGV